MTHIKEKLLEILPHRTIFNEPMKKHTSLKTGGNADIFVTPHNEDELQLILSACKSFSLSPIIIGAGSNVLVSDEGLKTVVIQLIGDFQSASIISPIGDNFIKVFAGAGLLNSRFVTFLSDNSLGGMEFLATIPGRIGGAIIMNAGAFGQETSQSVLSVTYFDTISLEKKEITDQECKFEYRKSSLDHAVITGAFFRVIQQDMAISRKKIEQFRDARSKTQPLNAPNAGSIFKNPPGHYAAYLIEQAGLKNLSIGDAIVSEKHANFIINKGNATSDNVYQLIKKIQTIIFDRFAIHLEPEVKFLGTFLP